MTRNLAKIDTIIVHCADVDNGRVTTVEEIDAWHKDKGFRRATRDLAHQPHLKFIGYHAVVYTTGVLVAGRDVREVGATAKGWNSRSVGVCLVGRDRFAPEQWTTLRAYIRQLEKSLGRSLKVIGHRDVNTSKSCPGFDVAAWVESGFEPPPEHVLQDGGA